MLKKATVLTLPAPGDHFTRPPWVCQDSPSSQGRALSQTRPQLRDGPRFTFHASRFTVLGSDTRTPLGERRVSASRGWAGERSDFFSFLLARITHEASSASARCQARGAGPEAGGRS